MRQVHRVDDVEAGARVERAAAPVHTPTGERIDDAAAQLGRRVEPVGAQFFNLPPAQPAIDERDTPGVIGSEALRNKRRRRRRYRLGRPAPRPARRSRGPAVLRPRTAGARCRGRARRRSPSSSHDHRGPSLPFLRTVTSLGCAATSRSPRCRDASSGSSRPAYRSTRRAPRPTTRSDRRRAARRPRTLRSVQAVGRNTGPLAESAAIGAQTLPPPARASPWGPLASDRTASAVAPVRASRRAHLAAGRPAQSCPRPQSRG